MTKRRKPDPPADSLERLADFTRRILAVPKEKFAAVEPKKRHRGRTTTKTKAHA